jgi:phage tail protein X
MRSVFTAVVLALLVAAGWGGLTGCQPNENLPFASEVDEPHYRRGMQLLRGGRSQEALEAFLKVVAKRGGDAPESHLECGILYLQHIKDPVAAIYHFNKYLALRPNSPQAKHTGELIETAKKEFARTLPAEPFEGQVERLDLREAVERLTQENYQLKEQIAQMRGLPVSSLPRTATALDAPPRTSPAVDTAQTEVVAEDAVTSEDGEAAPMVPVQAARPVASVTAPPPVANLVPAQNWRPVAAPTPPATARVHTIGKGDSLYSISRKYYGTGAKVDEIVAANRGVLQDRSTPLKIGMQLKLP